MTQTQKRSECKTMCWIIAAIAGLVLMLLLYKLIGLGGFLSFVLGLIGGLLLAYFLPRYICTGDQAAGAGNSDAGTSHHGATGAGSTAAAPASAATTSADARTTSSENTAPAVAPAGVVSTDPVTASAPASNMAAAPLMSAEIKPSTPLAGEAELASRKGTWKYEAPAAEETPVVKKTATKKTTPKTTAKKPAEPKTTKADAPATKAAKKPTAKKAAATPAAAKTPAKAKATAKAPAKGDPKAPAKAASTKAPAKGAVKAPVKAAPKRAPVAADGKPLVYDAAPAEGSDDLKLISGVGPKLEQTLNDLGIYRFDQVAGWRKKEVAWVDARLRFKGRIERDDWMSQAKILAKGGETEFSRKRKK
ncbi:hypothetical protein [Sulfitobacter geojensis]|uniref:hypothetical protein n=1 Tax=Sulfitobacter geojensis TaxID=1342299 RepID=UPI000469B297|nr:hypothetical protein [Sulfitobacter geojensis]NYI28592.1 putative flap endonuclease-1-like 5' DNA nuclease [Sulfitobacter geojensis]